MQLKLIQVLTRHKLKFRTDSIWFKFSVQDNLNASFQGDRNSISKVILVKADTHVNRKFLV